MDLREAYRVLELSPGASEDAVRDARNTLAKVWHPDRHANDPELQKKAQLKLADVNAAFSTIRDAKFPSVVPEPRAARPVSPKPTPKPAPKPEPTPTPKPEPAKAKKRSQRDSELDFMPKRRVRAWVIVLVAAAIGLGAYFAIVTLGSRPPRVADPVQTPPPGDAGAIADAAEPIGESADATDLAALADAVAPAAGDAAAPTAAWTLGSTREQVLAIEGEPKKKFTVITEDWSYGFSSVKFDPNTGKVVGWDQRDVELRVKLEPRDPVVAERARATGSFGIGSSKDEVIGLHGAPRSIDVAIDETWSYGRSRIDFDKSGRVTGWHVVNGELKTR